MDITEISAGKKSAVEIEKERAAFVKEVAEETRLSEETSKIVQDRMSKFLKERTIAKEYLMNKFGTTDPLTILVEMNKSQTKEPEVINRA